MFFDTISKPGEPTRYRYVVVLITILVLLVIFQGPGVLSINIPVIKWKGLLLYLTVIVILFIWYDNYGKKQTKSIQEDLDKAWSFFHACFYFGLAYFIPNNWPLLMTFMVCWELFEDHMGFTVGQTYFIETDGKKIQDILCNCTGYFLGSLAFNQRWQKRKI